MSQRFAECAPVNPESLSMAGDLDFPLRTIMDIARELSVADRFPLSLSEHFHKVSSDQLLIIGLIVEHKHKSPPFLVKFPNWYVIKVVRRALFDVASSKKS